MTVPACIAWVRRYSGITEIGAPDAYIRLFLEQAYQVTCARLASRLAGRMVRWFTVKYPANHAEFDIQTVVKIPIMLLIHVGKASSDGMSSVEVLSPADERDFGALTPANFRRDTYSTIRWRYADGLLKLYPVPSTDINLRIGVVHASMFLPEDDKTGVFDFLGPSLQPLAARIVALYAARDLLAVNGENPMALSALLNDTWNELEVVARGQVAQAEPIPGVAWRDDVA